MKKLNILRPKALWFSLVLLLFGLSLPVNAANFNAIAGGDMDCTVATGGGEGNLQACLDAANADGEASTIFLSSSGGNFNSGPYNHVAAEDFALTLQNAAGESPVLDGNNTDQILSLNTNSNDNSPILISGLTFQNAALGAIDIVSDDLSSTTIEDSEFLNNDNTGSGGAIDIFNGYGGMAIRNSRFEGNSSNGSGGALYFNYYGGDIDISNNSFVGNQANTVSVNSGGGAFRLIQDDDLTSNIVVFNNWISDNTSGAEGGGALVQFQTGSLTLSNNIVVRNEALGEEGGSLSLNQEDTLAGEIILTHNTIAQNSSQSEGGGLFLVLTDSNSSAQVYNNILWGNQSTAGSGADFYINEDRDTNGDAGTLDFFNNDISSFFSYCRDDAGAACVSVINEGSNVDLDPGFVNPAADDYHLDETLPSPILTLADPTAPAAPVNDFDGNARPNPAGTNPDIGALESPPPPMDPPPPPPPPPVEDPRFIEGSGTALSGCTLNPAIGANNSSLWVFLASLVVLLALRAKKLIKTD